MSSQKKGRATVYEILEALAEEIVQGIRNLNAPESSIDAIDADISTIKEDVMGATSPEAELVTKLFRKYAGDEYKENMSTLY